MDGKDIAAEADVLVSYGEFLIVVQANRKEYYESKGRCEEALKTDFKGAIQDPYRQASTFAELVEAGRECVGSMVGK